MRHLTKHLVAETDFLWANVGAGITDAGVVLIDCPVRPSDSRQWQKELQALSPKGIRYRISTDYHGDHTIGSAFIEDERVISVAPQRVFEELSKTDGSSLTGRETFINTMNDIEKPDEANEIAEAVLPLPQVCFEKGMTLHLPPLTFEIHCLGGHTPACSSVYVPEEGVIFTSDVVINEPGPGMREAIFQQWIKGLEWIESLDVAYVVPGHGEICGIEEVRKFKNNFVEMWGLMKDLLDKGRDKETATADTVFEKFFWSDTSRGESWIEHRRRTFQKGLENLYTEVKGG
ncbi:MAG: MBL fold metallo-hydrolase [Nitrospinaceae bacterium]|jgi:cyclase|nr:MBL fold metallo-hydrolase [Nitrospinaceae bacterium]MBT3433566.1 MBL fold metallo-hydrolase [Nitrospinaceae bacterium]MBT3819924.1 MBL fold metallo-hydrolase [Nitrospinaceae bacterium]MBT4092835.1 MBL fold metallo-hydrolase [Nitrospinaceae bacterium]MBT5368159.1 MBL fold metallo-hydrolase [Nitrospinaceae bacterium]